MRKKFDDDIVYSTDPDFKNRIVIPGFLNKDEEPTLEMQKLECHIDKKRKGKGVVIIKGFRGSSEDLKTLGKELKAYCGVGGSVKEGEILLQGMVREKATEYLIDKGHQVKRVGG